MDDVDGFAHDLIMIDEALERGHVVSFDIGEDAPFFIARNYVSSCKAFAAMFDAIAFNRGRTIFI